MQEQELKEVMLSTIDNPYDPFVQYDEWYAFDVSMGYNSCSYLAHVAMVSYDLSIVDQHIALLSAIEEIIKININGKYIKVEKGKFITIAEREANRRGVLAK